MRISAPRGEQLIEANGRRAKERSGLLGKTRDLDLTEWVEVATGSTPATKETK